MGKTALVLAVVLGACADLVPPVLAVDAGMAADAAGSKGGDDGGSAADGSMADAPLPALDCATTVPAGFTRRPTPAVFTQVPSVNYPGTFLYDFPNTGGGVGRVLARANQYVALRFTAPADPALYAGLAHRIEWSEAQTGGGADLAGTYVTISTCAGDLRVPPGDVAPANDPTYRHGCRNWRPVGTTLSLFRTLEYTIAGAPGKCPIVLGQTYYFNVAIVNPNDGIQPGELHCPAGSPTECGIQLKAE
jgi:hypothetical protein